MQKLRKITPYEVFFKRFYKAEGLIGVKWL